MSNQIQITDREAFLRATELIDRFGEFALSEAAVQADRSRSLGNVHHFCHWRQVERTIEMLSLADVTDTIH